MHVYTSAQLMRHTTTTTTTWSAWKHSYTSAALSQRSSIQTCRSVPLNVPSHAKSTPHYYTYTQCRFKLQTPRWRDLVFTVGREAKRSTKKGTRHYYTQYNDTEGRPISMAGLTAAGSGGMRWAFSLEGAGGGDGDLTSSHSYPALSLIFNTPSLPLELMIKYDLLHTAAKASLSRGKTFA